jgi:hypothetical protein
MRHLIPVLALLPLLAGCGQSMPGDPLLKPDALGSGSIAGELIHSNSDTPPSAAPGQCWADAVTPAVYETDTVHQLVRPATPATASHPAEPAEYQTVTRQRIVKDRERVWFRTPCPAVMTPDFIGSLQRALLARGYYRGPLTGAMDAPTTAALRRYQDQIGLDSAILALATARRLGLVAYDLGRNGGGAGTGTGTP